MRDKKVLALIKNTAILALGKISTQFTSLLLIPLFTHALNVAEYGIADLYVTYIGLFTPVLSLQLEMALFRFLIDARNNKTAQKKIFSDIFLFVTIIVITFLVAYFIICIFMDFPHKILLPLCIICTIYSNLLLQAARGLGKNAVYAIGSAVTGVSNIIVSIVLVTVFHMGGGSILASMAISNLLCIIFVFFAIGSVRLLRVSRPNHRQIKKYLQYALPLVPNSILWWIINASDRTIIHIFLGATANGVYSVSHKISSIISAAYGIFNLSWTESISLHIHDHDNGIFLNKIFKSVTRFSAILCGIIIFILPLCFDIIIGADYHEAYNYIPILIFSSFLNVLISFVGGIYIALKKTGEIAKTSIISGVINIAINLILIHYIGLYAAAISTAFAYLVMCVYRIIDVRRYVRLRLDFQTLSICTLSFLLPCLLYYLL